MNKRQRRILSMLIGCSLMLGASAAMAAEQEFNLENYVVTANRIPVKQADTAASVTVINREEIEKGGYTRVVEILEKANIGVFDSGSSSHSISTVFINGDDRVLIMVDGRRINGEAAMVGGGKTNVNLNTLPSVKNIERIEIVRGPGSSLYGSDAAGGVINIITRKGNRAETTLSERIGSWGMRNYTLTTEGRENGFGYLITAERQRQDYFEYKNAKTGEVKRMPNSAVDRDTVSMKLDKDLGQGRSLELGWRYANSNDGYFLTAPKYPYHMPTAYEINRDNDVDLTYRWKNKVGTDSYLKAYHSYDLIEYHHYMEGTAYPAVDNYLEKSRTTGVEWQDNWKLTNNDDLVGGVSWRKINVDIPAGSVYNKEITNKAIFLENHWQLPGDWTLTAGMRHDDHNVFGGKNTVRLAVNRKINNDTNIYASWGQFFRAPIVEELYSVGLPMGNPDLRPEKGDTFTLGMNTKLSAGTNLQASVFSSRLDDAIVWRPKDGLFVYENVAKQKRQGLDISLTHQLSPMWNISTGYAYVQVREKGQGADDYRNEPTNTQPNGYRLSIGYDDHNKWDGQLMLRGATGRDLTAYTSSAYWVVDLAANYKINANLKAYLKAYNLNNRAYEMKGVEGLAGEFPMAARHFYFGLEQRI
ncbi:Vitamin B12 transporter BtuB precursor [Sporomusa ovata DSM 2662]|uniref:TonB-dependent receptor Outer membrane receptor for ferrienterochelin and colicins n=1 Tax=Sporomusa ovata TaxID=2378 RepID=A0A0U1KSC6_9FIRM|nr:TonB-dependent receptor [Sporomusa ovata]EQB24966.1 vitamin B12 transporter BtuB [Sporomusa ovata DSM 2662]CQR70165.1 TonB-dependent receptor; Outer membrane receptor for ferrienterochelin and colicins [Sporomusa ovata]